MATTEPWHYRGYDILPQRQWSGWCVGIHPTRADLPLLAAIGASEAGANAAYAVATLTGALSVAAVLASLYPAVTVLLARQLHGEQLRRVQLAGVVATLVGVTCIATGGGP